MPSCISIIAAMAENRVIGVNNRLPWRLPADLKHFRKVTTGHPVIMGRKNYESIGKPLPDRKNIVVTHRPDYVAPGCLVVHSLNDALQAAQSAPEAFIIGGAEIYRQSFALARRLYLTLIHTVIPGDTYFPSFDARDWREVARERFEADTMNPHAFSFVVLERP